MSRAIAENRKMERMRAASPIHALGPATGLLAGLLGSLLPAGSEAQPGWVSGTYVYADLCTLPASGDLSGHRITLRRSPNGNGLVYEVGRQGSGPVAATGPALVVDDAARTVAFTAETEAGPISFEGTLAPDLLAGILSDASGAHPLRLPRVLRAGARRACSGPEATETTGTITPAR
ncbi:hypothetical protein [Methylobacterium oxalidis]|uniref:Uncharacterized protein n=1 Tax=Methylobacterium oxalidis TaxID=944322 RepID=A0A512J5I1_9HYPH|nr:hypothetical protein [Methylobacterium oxalidis]GEP05170.1 hypothetical protein MOX02_32080 [Methylobacterium oxalidis]GJE31820.1 hypothetical protein LDDCCGHA_2000 [Methylobacterium oxalidis]GLS62538.1 hypothetical protein GCM10007888_09190 [Methylobacterium oxalidis]